MTRDQLYPFLAAYGIAPRELVVTQLEGGGGNLVLLLQADGRKLVLRRYERIPSSEAEFELRLVQFLTERGFPTQPLLVRTDGSLSSPLPDCGRRHWPGSLSNPITS